MAQKHSRPIKGGRAVWMTERLWTLTRDLPVRSVRLETIREFEENCWFGNGDEPTCSAVTEHAREIAEADLQYPIILSADGRLMDGGHRICKAWLCGQTEIAAVQFAVDPEPDYIVPDAFHDDGRI